MRDEGLLTFYNLQNVNPAGMKPLEQLVSCGVTAYYKNQTIGVQRQFIAQGADYKLDKLVRCYNTIVPGEAKYVILEDLKQYRINNINVIIDEDGVELSLERLEKLYEVLDESNQDSNG